MASLLPKRKGKAIDGQETSTECLEILTRLDNIEIEINRLKIDVDNIKNQDTE